MEVTTQPSGDIKVRESEISEPLRFENGVLLIYRLFDVASEIHLERAQELLAGAAKPLRLSLEPSKYLQFPRAP